MNETQHGVTEQKRVLSIVESPCHLIKASGQMLRRHTMPRSYKFRAGQRQDQMPPPEMGIFSL
jgi:hypothetical protein